MMSLSDEKFLIFLHIQKTGGITIQRMLRQKYGPSLPQRALKMVSGNAQPLPLEASLKSKEMRDRYFAGHICFGVHRLLPQPYHYITLLREPVARVISLYDFARSNPTAFYHKIARRVSFEEFCLDVGLPELDNGQTRFIAGDRTDLFINQTPVGECDDQLLATAKKNMENHFSLVGLTEQFNLSMLLLAKLMGWSSCQYLRLNSNSHKTAVPEEIKAQIAARNSLDVALYDYAKTRFFEAVKAQGIDEQALADFEVKNRKLNAQFSQPYKIYHKAKSALRGQIHRP